MGKSTFLHKLYIELKKNDILVFRILLSKYSEIKLLKEKINNLL